MSSSNQRRARGARRLVLLTIVSALLVAVSASEAVAAASNGLNNGMGTAAALNSPQCDKQRGRIKFVYEGWVPCVKPWPANGNNGGATSPGVTKDSVKVVVLKPPDEETNTGRSPIKDRATGALATVEDSVRDTLPMFEKTYQQWGRKLDVTVVQDSGTDETAQRADAVKVASMHPFAVVDLTGGDVFETAVAAKKIVVVGGSSPNKESIAQAPYRWPVAIDFTTTALAGAELIGKNFAGKPAKFAGDSNLQSKKRVFGTVLSDAKTAPDFQPAFAELKKYGVTIAPNASLTYTPSTDPAQASTVADQAAPTLIAKLKDAGVTSILVLPTDYQMIGSLTKAAANNDYHPEWIVMGVGYADIGALTRTFDQGEWSHAFGVSGLWVPVKDLTAGPSDVAFQWYWGPNAGAYSQGVFADFELLFAGIHMAGPKLTPQNFQAGMFSRPPTAGAAEGHVTDAARYYGKNAGLPYNEYLTGGDVAIVWWDSDTVGPSVAVNLPDAKGVYQFVDGAKRYKVGDLPANVGNLMFDKAKSIDVLPTTPPNELAPDYPCDGCPSATPTS
ncbi:MAG TPA: hypothetical protein VH986_11765 [Acidimicrobiia bacterium]